MVARFDRPTLERPSSGAEPPEPPDRSVRLLGRTYPVRLPRAGDPRLMVAGIITSVQVLGQTVLDFDLSDQEKAAAYDDGYRAAEEFLSTWDWARYVAEFR